MPDAGAGVPPSATDRGAGPVGGSLTAHGRAREQTDGDGQPPRGPDGPGPRRRHRHRAARPADAGGPGPGALPATPVRGLLPPGQPGGQRDPRGRPLLHGLLLVPAHRGIPVDRTAARRLVQGGDAPRRARPRRRTHTHHHRGRARHPLRPPRRRARRGLALPARRWLHRHVPHHVRLLHLSDLCPDPLRGVRGRLPARPRVPLPRGTGGCEPGAVGHGGRRRPGHTPVHLRRLGRWRTGHVARRGQSARTSTWCDPPD